MNLLTLRLENVSERFNKLEAEVGAARKDMPLLLMVINSDVRIGETGGTEENALGHFQGDVPRPE